MSKLNQPTNLRVEDYPDQASWIGRLFNVLNPFVTSVQQVFDSNIEFSTNIRSVTREFDSSALTFPLKFAWPFTQADPQDLRVTKATVAGVATALIPAWSFDASTREISVTALTVLSSSAASAIVIGTRYKFTVRATV